MKTLTHASGQIVVSIEDDGGVSIWCSDPNIDLKVWNWCALANDLDDEEFNDEETKFSKCVDDLHRIF